MEKKGYEPSSGWAGEDGQPWRGSGLSRREARSSSDRWQAAREIVAMGYQRPVPPSGSFEPARQMQSDGAVKIVETQKEREEKLPSGWCDEPWNLKDFEFPKMKGKDAWSLQLWERGWLVRVHSTGRQKRFQPVHESLPCNADQLDGMRVTVAWLSSGEKYILEDSWLERFSHRHLSEWRGYIFLKRATASNYELGQQEGHVWDDDFSLVK